MRLAVLASILFGILSAACSIDAQPSDVQPSDAQPSQAEPSAFEVINGHGIGAPIECPPYWCEAATAAVERAVAEPISRLAWHDEVFLDRDGNPIGIDVGGLQQPVAVAIATTGDGSVIALRVLCGPEDCEAQVDNPPIETAPEGSWVSFFSGDEAQLADVVQDDIVAMNVIGMGSFSYDTQNGGHTTASLFDFKKITVKGSCE